MDDKKMELSFVSWKDGYLWSSGKIEADGKLEIWKSMIERNGEDVEKRNGK